MAADILANQPHGAVQPAPGRGVGGAIGGLEGRAQTQDVAVVDRAVLLDVLPPLLQQLRQRHLQPVTLADALPPRRTAPLPP